MVLWRVREAWEWDHGTNVIAVVCCVVVCTRRCALRLACVDLKLALLPQLWLPAL